MNYILKHLLVVDHILETFLGVFGIVYEIVFQTVCRKCVLIFFSAEMIDDQIMCNTVYPAQESAGFNITTLLNCRNCLDKSFLKNIFGEFLVSDYQKNIGKNTGFIPVNITSKAELLPFSYNFTKSSSVS